MDKVLFYRLSVCKIHDSQTLCLAKFMEKPLKYFIYLVIVIYSIILIGAGISIYQGQIYAKANRPCYKLEQ